jgi:hypothetical protein
MQSDAGPDLARTGARLRYCVRQPHEGAQPSLGLAQAQGWQVQSVHLQASILFISTFVMVTSLVLVADEQGSKVSTMVRSQA